MILSYVMRRDCVESLQFSLAPPPPPSISMSNLTLIPHRMLFHNCCFSIMYLNPWDATYSFSVNFVIRVLLYSSFVFFNTVYYLLGQSWYFSLCAFSFLVHMYIVTNTLKWNKLSARRMHFLSQFDLYFLNGMFAARMGWPWPPLLDSSAHEFSSSLEIGWCIVWSNRTINYSTAGLISPSI